jgi:4-hydroxy-2-oxoheptanedioate aldolase
MNMNTKSIRRLLVLLFLIPWASFAQEDYVHLNKVIAKLENGKLVTGIWVQSLSPSNAMSIIEYNGFPSQQEALNKPMIDFVLIEMEHAPYDITKLRTFLLALNSKREVIAKGNLQPSLAAFARLPVEGGDPVHALIKQALDMGVHGLVVPHVRTAEQALKIVKACRYVQREGSPYKDPQGDRGASPQIAAYLWGLSLEEYTGRADVWPLNPHGDIMVIIMIEDKEGVNNIEEILKVPGIGAVIFGPYDYSFSSGNFGNTKAASVTEALNKVKKSCDGVGMPFVGFADPENITEMLKEGYKMLLIGSDVDKSGGASRVLDHLREN